VDGENWGYGPRYEKKGPSLKKRDEDSRNNLFFRRRGLKREEKRRKKVTNFSGVGTGSKGTRTADRAP